MKNLKISIKKAKIFSNVSLNTAYTGAKSEALDGFFERVATVSDDDTLLSNLWKDMTGIILEKLKPYISETTVNTDSLDITFLLSNSFDDSLALSLEEDINTSFVAGVTARWFRFSSPDKAAEWESEASRAIDSTLSKLCYRRPPKRT